MRYKLELSNQEKKKFYKKLDIIDIVFNISSKDYESIYTRDHEYLIRFNSRAYRFKSKAAVNRFTIDINYQYTIRILELDDIYQSVFIFYRNFAHLLSRVNKDLILQLISGIEYQFKYFAINRFKANYNYYVTIQVAKIINQLKEILLLLTKRLSNQDNKSLYMLFWRLDNLDE